jgi:hypothetical protein
LVNDVPWKLIQLNCLADATSAATGRSGPELGKKRRTFGLPNCTSNWAALLVEGRWSVNALTEHIANMPMEEEIKSAQELNMLI